MGANIGDVFCTYIRVLAWQLARLAMHAWFRATVSHTGHHRWYWMRVLGASKAAPARGTPRTARALAAPMKVIKAVV